MNPPDKRNRSRTSLSRGALDAVVNDNTRWLPEQANCWFDSVSAWLLGHDTGELRNVKAVHKQLGLAQEEIEDSPPCKLVLILCDGGPKFPCK